MHSSEPLTSTKNMLVANYSKIINIINIHDLRGIFKAMMSNY